MKLLFVGAGYVGLVSGTCFSDLGNDVICADVDEKKIEALKQGKMTIYEPGLKDLFDRSVERGRLSFTTDIAKAIKESEVIFICVGTPSKANGEADLRYVYAVAEEVGKNIERYTVIVDKSTVPAGTADKVSKIISKELKKRKAKIEYDVVSNPEFLKEGSAVKDFQNPDRVVIGSSSQKASDLMGRLYKPLARAERPIIFTSEKNAELIKYASNAMLATRISFMNELSFLCEALGGDIKIVAKGMGLDKRIGSRFLQASCGYGGSCFPKDVKALAQMLEHHGLSSNIMRAVDYVNERQKKSIIPKLKKYLPKLEGKTIAIWGLSFKPRTDDIRESATLTVIEQLLKEDANIRIYDPEAMENGKKLFLKEDAIKFTKDVYDAIDGADALLVMTEWDEFREPDFNKVKKLMKEHIIIDGRNVFDPEEMKKTGIKYQGVGR
ncbi:UDP-glucose/GDP-mannose dehydrogenase family protein [Candidatus Woesearchaeota archaeon]|nr:UDP-glucose/GDP-mannose dehydrogenase family protein [Candidatus Woesearchaeota archaeon]